MSVNCQQKEVEAYIESIGITKEVTQEARKRNILSEEKILKEKKDKLEASTPKPRHSRRNSPSSGPVKSSTSSTMPFNKGEKNKIVRFVIVKDDEETNFDDAVKKVKKKGTKATKVIKEKLFDSDKTSKKPKTYGIDEVIKKVRFTVKPPMSLDEIVNKVVKNRNLEPMSEWYDNCDDNGKRTSEEATINYLNDYNKSLMKIMLEIPKGYMMFWKS